MPISSVFSVLKGSVTKKSTLLSLAIAGTSATSGGVASYFLFGEESIEKVEEEKRDFESTRRTSGDDRFAKVFPLMKEQLQLKRKTECLKNEMESHDKNIGTWGTSSHTPNFKYCKNIKVI